MDRIYFDHNATTPLSPPVTQAIAGALAGEFGNASSVHYFGQRAKAAIDEARAAVARLVGGEPSEIVFTSGGTEADNLAIRGAVETPDRSTRRHIIASGIEHEAVINTLKALERRGWRTTFLKVDASGIVSPDALGAALDDDTAIVSVMHANNEIGTVQPVAELARAAHERGALFHTDAVQSIGKIPVDVRMLGVDLLSLSGHKFGGPKGAGALWIRRGVRLTPHTTGGRQERGRRAGTENVPGLVGLGVAARMTLEKLGTEPARLATLRDRLEQGILSRVPGTARNGASEPRVSNTTNIGFDRVEAESLLIALDLEGFAVSTGSACSSGTLEPSHVLRAMGLPPARTANAIRFSLGSGNTVDQVDKLIAVLPGIVEKLRSLNGVNVRSRGPRVPRS